MEKQYRKHSLPYVLKATIQKQYRKHPLPYVLKATIQKQYRRQSSEKPVPKSSLNSPALTTKEFRETGPKKFSELPGPDDHRVQRTSIQKFSELGGPELWHPESSENFLGHVSLNFSFVIVY